MWYWISQDRIWLNAVSLDELNDLNNLNDRSDLNKKS